MMVEEGRSRPDPVKVRPKSVSTSFSSANLKKNTGAKPLKGPVNLKVMKNRSLNLMKTAGGLMKGSAAPSGLVSKKNHEGTSLMRLIDGLRLNSTKRSEKRRFESPHYFNRNAKTNQAKLLHTKFEEALKENGMKFEIYSDTFEDIIEKNLVYKTGLRRTKDAYDQKLTGIQAKSLFASNEELTLELENMRNSMSEDNEYKARIENKIEKFSRENEELGRRLESTRDKHSDIQDTYLSIQNLPLNDVHKDNTHWGLLVAENRRLSDLCKITRKDNKTLRRTERKLLKLLMMLKKQGIPIEEIYQSDVRKRRKEKAKNGTTIEEISDSEEENIVDEPPKTVFKPEMIPLLRMGEVESELSDNIDSDY